MSIPTPLETSGGTYTTYDEEMAFYAALAADSPRFAHESLGRAGLGPRDMLLIRIGAPSAPASPVDGGTDSMLITACQHGNEWAAREVTIRLIRDLVYTTDPTLVQYLTNHPIFIMPTTSPDVIESQTRVNGRGSNINRDHLRLGQYEARAMMSAVKRIRPTVVYDIHEYAGGTAPYDMAAIPPSHPQIGAPTRLMGAELDDAVAAAVTGAGWLVGEYIFASVTLPTMFVNAVSLVYGMPAYTPETPIARELPARMSIHNTAALAAIEWHRTRTAAIQAHTAESIRIKKREGARADKPFRLMDSAVVLNPPPVAYRLTAAQHSLVAQMLDLMSIEATPDGDDWIVSMAQTAQPAIPLMFDSESPYVVTAGERVMPKPSGVIESWGPLRIDGKDHQVVAVEMQVDGALRRIWP